MKTRKIKVRNPFVAHVVTKRSGAHGKSNKAVRRANKVSLRGNALMGYKSEDL